MVIEVPSLVSMSQLRNAKFTVTAPLDVVAGRATLFICKKRFENAHGTQRLFADGGIIQLVKKYLNFDD